MICARRSRNFGVAPYISAIPAFPGQPGGPLLHDAGPRACRGIPRCGRIAQLVEQLTLNQRVQGSSPCAPTTKSATYAKLDGASGSGQRRVSRRMKQRRKKPPHQTCRSRNRWRVEDARATVAFIAQEHEVSPTIVSFPPVAANALSYGVQRSAAPPSRRLNRGGGSQWHLGTNAQMRGPCRPTFWVVPPRQP
jgi:hypothetical protein